MVSADSPKRSDTDVLIEATISKGPCGGGKVTAITVITGHKTEEALENKSSRVGYNKKYANNYGSIFRNS